MVVPGMSSSTDTEVELRIQDGIYGMPSFVWAFIAKYHRQGCLTNIFVCPSLGGWKFKVRMLAWFLFYLQILAVHCTLYGRKRKRAFGDLSFIRALISDFTVDSVTSQRPTS